MLWTYALKVFSENLNVLKLDGDGITPMEKFSGATIDITLKIATCGDVRFMSWMQCYKAVYLDYPGGNPACVQGSFVYTSHFMQDHYLWS